MVSLLVSPGQGVCGVCVYEGGTLYGNLGPI